jgi:hypothetical protein
VEHAHGSRTRLTERCHFAGRVNVATPMPRSRPRRRSGFVRRSIGARGGVVLPGFERRSELLKGDAVARTWWMSSLGCALIRC